MSSYPILGVPISLKSGFGAGVGVIVGVSGIGVEVGVGVMVGVGVIVGVGVGSPGFSTTTVPVIDGCNLQINV